MKREDVLINRLVEFITMVRDEEGIEEVVEQLLKAFTEIWKENEGVDAMLFPLRVLCEPKLREIFDGEYKANFNALVELYLQKIKEYLKMEY